MPTFALKNLVFRMEKRIIISKQAREKLSEMYGTVNVSRALNFRSNSFMSREIRQAAVNDHNGIIIKL
jgi:hypothetical protein